MPSDQTLVDQLGHVWMSLGALGGNLAEAEWKTPTEVPGWTVQDNLVHVTALAGDAADLVPGGDDGLDGDLPHRHRGLRAV